MDAHGTALVSWFCWWFPRHVGDGAEPRTSSTGMPRQAERAARRPGHRVRGVVALSASAEASSAGLGPHSSFSLGVFTPPTRQPCCGRGQGQRLTAVCWLIMYSECFQQHIPDQWCLSWRRAPAVEGRAPARGCQESWLLRPRPGSLWVEKALSPCRELFGTKERWTNRTSQEIDNYWLCGSELTKELSTIILSEANNLSYVGILN